LFGKRPRKPFSFRLVFMKFNSEEQRMKSIVITGASSGIGKATAKYFAKQGWRVAATMRKPENETELNQIANISLCQLDVTDEASVTNATQQILADFGTVDVVLN
jgi:NAD(P)-dependent dehydrogenase (short-subunit alcohol dehydrogenase family)